VWERERREENSNICVSSDINQPTAGRLLEKQGLRSNGRALGHGHSACASSAQAHGASASAAEGFSVSEAAREQRVVAAEQDV
jgi:hypothetical protein